MSQTDLRLAGLAIGDPARARTLPALALRFGLKTGVTEKAMMEAGWRSSNPPPPGIVYFEMARADDAATTFVELLVFDTPVARAHSLVRLERRPELAETINLLIQPDTTSVWMGDLGDLPAEFAPWGYVPGLDGTPLEDEAADADGDDFAAASFASADDPNEPHDVVDSDSAAVPTNTATALDGSARSGTADSLVANASPCPPQPMALDVRPTTQLLLDPLTTASATDPFDRRYWRDVRLYPGRFAATAPASSLVTLFRTRAHAFEPEPMHFVPRPRVAALLPPRAEESPVVAAAVEGGASPPSAPQSRNSTPNTPPTDAANTPPSLPTPPASFTFQHRPHAPVLRSPPSAVVARDLYGVAAEMCEKFGWATDNFGQTTARTSRTTSTTAADVAMELHEACAGGAPSPPQPRIVLPSPLPTPTASQHTNSAPTSQPPSNASFASIPVSAKPTWAGEGNLLPTPQQQLQPAHPPQQQPSRRQTLCALVEFASGGRKRCFVDTQRLPDGKPPAVGDRVSVRMPRGGLRVGTVATLASWSMRKASGLDNVGVVEGPAPPPQSTRGHHHHHQNRQAVAGGPGSKHQASAKSSANRRASN